jgi:hypothetical protein
VAGWAALGLVASQTALGDAYQFIWALSFVLLNLLRVTVDEITSSVVENQTLRRVKRRMATCNRRDAVTLATT